MLAGKAEDGESRGRTMRRERGDIWDCLRRGYHVVVPVNEGWNKEGRNVMGKGLAKDAKFRFPDCDLWLGDTQTKLFKSEPCIPIEDARWLMAYPFGPLIFFPTKPLNRERPWLSWANLSDLEMIRAFLHAFPAWAKTKGLERIAFPLLGAGNGKLDPFVVESLMASCLKDTHFTLVTPI